jgi:hypothetical protein
VLMSDDPKPLWCRHCVRLYSGACPYPGVKSVHRMQLSAAQCRLAALHPAFRALYTANMVNRIHRRCCGSARAGLRPATCPGPGPAARKEA